MELESETFDPRFTVPARHWHPLSDGRIQCDVCPRQCRLHPGQRGMCFVRANQDGDLVLTTYGRSSGYCVDPIEKKPLNHYFPGTSVLSFGTAGCNLACKFCQNWSISKSREMQTLADEAPPEKIAEVAARLDCHSVAFTYNDPVIFLEYALDTAKECRERDIRTVAVTAGYISPGAREEFFDGMDAANVDLKGFTEEFYHKVTASHLAPVLETLKYIRNETDVWLEITTLLIPGFNDSREELARAADWILDELGPDVPWHFSAFHPDYRMLDVPPTPPETLTMARELAMGRGIRYAYTGNVHDERGQSTYCHVCGKRLIGRNWYSITGWELTEDGRCNGCGEPLPGHFEDKPGRWGSRRLPVRLADWA